ncbi:DUF397 domain-containing protein [Streptomyces sp. ME02-8801-2C]|uniref:DUF397 domain-containing protein n=1 Tax=Streptomyces sp. ME02-8801-2C TaxID=3028680 RepID=UPI0029B559A4|nr:DUF397 domain-containing protein [Streptomyces sp. ME02-8801-2C]MDX3455305.1 DUF397 domain-containing protein [Streptomyces sp. ME02-8801-2C]
MTPHWQKSSYCSEGASCVHIAATPEGIHLTESGDPTGATLTTTSTTFRALLTTLKTDAPPPKEFTLVTTPEDSDNPDPDTLVHLHSTTTPGTVVTTDRQRWDTFVLGVRAGEFDHFVRPRSA